MIESKEIQRPFGRALGDCWMILNYFINESLQKREITRLSSWYNKGSGQYKRKRDAIKLKEILPLLEHKEVINLGDWEPNMPKIHWTLGWKYPYVSTIIKWKPNTSHKICYQFDAKSKAPARFPSPEIENMILQHATKLGYEPIKLGIEKTLEECVICAANCELFLGVDSGMLHLAASVGLPVLLCKNERPIDLSCNQSNKHFMLSNNYIELMDQLSNYNKFGVEFYRKNARNINLFKLEDKS